MRCVDLLRLAPGRARDVAHALSAQRSSVAVDALLLLPPTVPGVVEGVFQALARGLRRGRPSDGNHPAALAIDFRSSRARNFPDTLAGARRAFGRDLERLRVNGKDTYRTVIPTRDDRLRARGATLPRDLQWLHSRVARLKGTRLWLNGWCFPQDGPMGPAIQVHLLQAWLGFATHQAKGEQTHERGASAR